MKFFTKCLLLLSAVLFLFGCASKQMTMLPEFQAKQFDASMYSSKVDNFLILFDASSSMNLYGNFDVAKALVYRMNDTIPELGQTAGLRSFGHSPKVSKTFAISPKDPNDSTKLIYGMEKYLSFKLENTLDKVSECGGFSPLYKAMDGAGMDLKGLAGTRNAVIIISDGLEKGGDTLAAAKRVKDMYGSSVCFYPILVGNAPEGEALLKQIAEVGGCGFYSKAEDLLTSDGMAAFVEKVFLDKKPAAPAAPALTMKKDSDGDGVYDDKDQCPGTPVGAKVNTVGCWVLDNVLFDFDKDVIKTEAYPLLDDVAKILEKNPVMSVELQGHCDNVGTPEYNMDLSLRRARAVKAYLVGKGILKNRIATEGFGFTKPVALNGTAAGRALNRRVEIHPY